MKIKKYGKESYYMRIELNNSGSIDINFPHKNWNGSNNQGGISWSAVGTKSIKDTQEFIKGLQTAINIYKKGK